MPETTTTTDLPTITLDPSLCCCGTTTTPEPNLYKCTIPLTFDFHTNVIVPITLEINMPRGGSGFPEQNLFLKTYIHGCNDIYAAFCYYKDNVLVTSSPTPVYAALYYYNDYYSDLEYRGDGPPSIPSWAHQYFYIKEPANCNVRIPVVVFAVTETTSAEGNLEYGSCSSLRTLSINDYLSYVRGIYGYLPNFVWLLRRGFSPEEARRNRFSLNGSNFLFTCCNRGVLQDLLIHKIYKTDEILDVVVDVAEFSPYVTLLFPVFHGMIARAWKRGELDNLILYGPLILYVGIKWLFRVRVKTRYGSVNLVYELSTKNIFVKILQLPFSGGSLDLDYYSHGAGCIYDYYDQVKWDYKPLHLDTRIRLPIIFPDILKVIENMRATIHFGEFIANPTLSEDGTIDWSRVAEWDPNHNYYFDYDNAYWFYLPS